jgi:hypothetical protein
LETLVSDPNQWDGLKCSEGPFIKSFMKGYYLLLDEINLAHPLVLNPSKQLLIVMKFQFKFQVIHILDQKDNKTLEYLQHTISFKVNFYEKRIIFNTISKVFFTF